jgi:hypothetical protein
MANEVIRVKFDANSGTDSMLKFVKQQEQKLAMRLLAWHYEKNAMLMPSPSELSQQADRLVNDAHHIARERGRNVLSIIKELVGEIRKR